jgi:AraC family transcriptional regulator
MPEIEILAPMVGLPSRPDPAVFQGDFGSIVIARAARSWVAHIHREHQMNFHMEGGDALIRNGDDTYLMRQGEYNLHNPWAAHSVKVDPGQPCLFVTINVSPAWLAVRQGLPNGQLPLFSRMHLKMSRRILALVGAVVATMQSQGVGAAEARIHELIGHVVTLHGASPRPAADTQQESDTARKIRRSIGFIERHAVGRIRINDVAAHAGMSRSHFFREFSHRVGTSPLHVIDAVRISWAAERLLKTNTPIADLGDELGFSTPSHFGRFFAAHIGLTPSEYRGPAGGACRSPPQGAGATLNRRLS